MEITGALDDAGEVIKDAPRSNAKLKRFTAEYQLLSR